MGGLSLSDLRLAHVAGKQRGLIRNAPYNINAVKRVLLTAISLDGRAAGYTDARNLLLADPVSSESFTEINQPTDGQRSLLKGPSATIV